MLISTKPSNTEPKTERITMVFTDIVDSTATKPRVGGDLAYFKRLLQPHNARLRQHLQQHSGCEVKTIGDSFMIKFDDATDAVNFAVAVHQHFQHEPLVERDITLAVRIGIHTGKVIGYWDETSGRLDYSGNTVDCAARVEALAVGGQILISEDTYWDVRRMQDGSFHDWGEYLLKGFEQHVVIWEVLWGDKQPQRPPGSYWLPPQELTKFVGRKRELLEVQQLVRNHRLVTILGMGGIGKSRLALEVAFRLADEMEGQIMLLKLLDLLIPTNGADNTEVLIPTIASALVRALELKSEQGNDREALMHFLKTRPLLLILDNCETVLPAVGFFEELLRKCSKLRLLATSQHPLGVNGEQKFHIEPMDIPSSAIHHESLDTFDSFLLFADRACHQKLDWKENVELSTIADLLQLTDGIPLAIELVASWVGYRPIVSLRDSLQANREEYLRRAEVSEHITEDADRRRHISMQTCLDWSFHLLSDGEQLLFKRLSIFISGFSLDAVKPVCNLSNPELLLDALYRRSLIKWQMVLGKQRYNMLLIVREYAEGKLGNEGEIYKKNMAIFLSHVLQEYNEVLRPGSSLLKARQLLPDVSKDMLSAKAVELTKNALTHFDHERLNCICSIEWAYHQGHWDLVTEMNDLMSLFFGLRPYWFEWERCCLRALEAARHSTDKSKEARALQIIGIIYFNQGQWDKSIKYREEMLKIYHELGNLHGEAIAREGIADVYYRQGYWEKARQMYLEVLPVFRNQKDRQSKEKVLHGIGNTYNNQGHLSEARRYYEESLVICEELNDLPSKAQTLAALGNVYIGRKEFAKALQLYEEALGIFHEFGDQASEATELLNLGSVHKMRHNWAEALHYYEQCLTIFQELRNRHATAMALGSLASIFEVQGKIDQAMSYYEEALSIEREIVDREGEGITLNNIGGCYLRQWKWQEAIDTLEQSVAVFSELSSPNEVVPLTMLWKVYLVRGKWAKAWRYYIRIVRLRRKFRQEGIQEGFGT